MKARQRVHNLIVKSAVAVAMALLASCGNAESVGFGGDIQELVRRGEVYARSLANRSADELTREDLVALGYLERARLGIGSPFRLIDFALSDPDLQPEIRQRLAYGILALTLAGETYQVDPVVLEPVRFFGVEPWARTGPRQLALISRTVRGAISPASGERAARLAYRIAESERTLENIPHSAVAGVTALLADRRRAMTDARTLLRTAMRYESDPLELLRAWRRQRRFSVEAPSLVPLTVAEEEAVARLAPLMARSLDALALRLMSVRATTPGALPGQPKSYLDGGAGERLLEITTERDYPVQAPVAVAVAIMRDGFIERPELPEWERDARVAFAEAAYNEERFVAAAARLRAASGATGPRLPLMQLQIATFLRAWGQEEPWFPGDPAPAARDLIARFGLAGIDFDPEVPDRWRPYAVRSLARGLSDLQRVLPTASVRGLTIRFGRIPRDVRALALHDPRTRTLYLPLESGAGTLAHEVAHDLDWQLARQRYGVRGGYATDMAVRRGPGDRIAASLQDLSAAFRRPGADTLIDRHDTRPAEVFARGSDWFIAVALAREGRTGGYLSSFQDPALTGYGSTRGPDVGGAAVPSLLAILDAVAPVVEDTRVWALAELGPTRILGPTELASAVLLAGTGRPPAERFAAIAAARDRSLSAVSSETCRLSSVEGIRRLAAAESDLILRSTSSASRGAAIDAIRDLAAERLGPQDERVQQWLAWRIYGAPEPTDSALVDLAPAFEDFFRHAEILTNDRRSPSGSPFRPLASVVLCGGNPFAAASRRASTGSVTHVSRADSVAGALFRF